MQPDPNQQGHPEQEPASAPVAPALDVVESEPTEPASDQQNQDTRKGPPARTKPPEVRPLLGISRRAYKVSNTIIAIATVANVGVAYWQFRAIGDANRSSERAARAAEDNVEMMRLDQRAWLTVSLAQSTLAAGKPFIAAVNIRNTGKTPAIAVRARVKLSHLPTGVLPAFAYDDIADVTPALLGPNATSSVVLDLVREPGKSQAVLQSAEVETIVRGGRTIFSHGEIAYFDVFDRPHWLTFCAFFGVDSNTRQWNFCSVHNETGDGEIPKR
jgi:hypothetical protein